MWAFKTFLLQFPPSVLTLRQIILPIRGARERGCLLRPDCLSSPSQHVQQFCCCSWPAVQNLPSGITLSIILNIKGIKCENKRHLYLRDDHGEGFIWPGHAPASTEPSGSSVAGGAVSTEMPQYIPVIVHGNQTDLPPPQCELARRIWSSLNG